jgi:glucose-1-phosphate thymidylyltransferase
VKALVLAAGYATRLRPLTDTKAKELLPVGRRPIVDWILDKVDEVDEVDEVHLVTNARKAPWFREWVGDRRVTIHDDGTTSNDDRLGAIGDMRFVLDSGALGGDDVLVIAGDNLFEFALTDYVAFWRSKGRASAVAVRDVDSLELAARYAVVELDADARVVGFVEKPDDPSSSLIATATYIFHHEHTELVPAYLDAGNPPDQPGRFVAWLQARERVYGYRFDERWFDIGDSEQLLEADNELRRRLGLPVRDEYSLDVGTDLSQT